MSFSPQARLAYGQPIMIPKTFITAVTGGDVLVVNGQVEIVHESAIAGAVGSVAIGHGVYDVVKTSGGGITFAQFASVYWDASANVATPTAYGNTYMGYATVAAADADTTVCVWLPGDTAPTSVFNGTSTVIADPGSSGAIPVTGNGHVKLVTAVAETRTLAAPTFVGQTLMLCGKTTTVTNTCTVTVAAAIDGSHTHIAFGTAGEWIILIAVISGSTLSWALLVNGGTTLS